MKNFKYCGELDGEKQLIGDEQLPDNAVQFKEGSDINELFQLGFVLMCPIIIPMIIITIVRLSHIEGDIRFNVKTAIILIAAILIVQILKYLHEFLHSSCYPKGSMKTVWKYAKNGNLFIYCPAHITKMRWVIISLVPMFVLGLIPFAIWLFIADKIDTEISMVFVVISWLMTFGSMGDLANVYNTMKQVPKNSKVFNYGLHSYWIKDEK
jgi:heme/copper-type cytochrome/quinol oxidase subunit 4